MVKLRVYMFFPYEAFCLWRIYALLCGLKEFQGVKATRSEILKSTQWLVRVFEIPLGQQNCDRTNQHISTSVCQKPQ